MSLDTTTSRVDYDGNGSASSFPYPFKIFSASELEVREIDDQGNETTLALNTEFEVSGVGSRDGGNVTRKAGALPSDYQWIIRRVRPFTQTTSIRNQGEYYASTHEDVFDKLTMLLQQLREEVDRTVKLPVRFQPGAFDPTLPSELDANRMLMVSDDGVGFAIGPTPEELSQAAENVQEAIDAAEAAVTSAATAAAAATTASNHVITAGRWAKQTPGVTVVDAVTSADSGEYSAKHYAQAAEAAAADAEAAAASFTGFQTSSAHEIIDGQSATTLTGETFDGTTVRQVDFHYSIFRGTTVATGGVFSIFFRDGTWVLDSGNYRGDVSGVTFSMTAQVANSISIEAAASAGAGNGDIVFNKVVFSQP